MTSKDFRKVLHKVQTDFDFWNLLLVNPERALSGFRLTAKERAILTKPDRSIYRYLAIEEEPEPEPTPPPSGVPFNYYPPPPPPPGITWPPGPPEPSPPEPPGPPEPNFPTPPLFEQPPEIFQAPPLPIKFLGGLLQLSGAPKKTTTQLLKKIRHSTGEQRRRFLGDLLKNLDGRSG
jgi:hypothetical protein